jgi:hypothetical protein
MALPGETEAGSAGTQPCRGIAWRAHRDDRGERGSRLSRSSQNPIGSKDPHALKIPARRAECSLTGNARIPFQAEPEHQTLLEAFAQVAERVDNAQLLLVGDSDDHVNSGGSLTRSKAWEYPMMSLSTGLAGR